MQRDIRISHPCMRGFTLMELMITIAIIAILATIALPSYQDQVRKTRRAEGQACLLDAAQRQERYFYQNNTYADALTKMGGYATDTVSCPEGGHYNLTVVSGNATAFALSATPVGAQLKDTRCNVLSITNLGVKGADGTKPDECW